MKRRTATYTIELALTSYEVDAFDMPSADSLRDALVDHLLDVDHDIPPDSEIDLVVRDA